MAAQTDALTDHADAQMARAAVLREAGGEGAAADAARRALELYEEKGNAAKAAEHYRAFIGMWKNADAELQPRVEDAKRRLAKLAPVEGKRP